MNEAKKEHQLELERLFSKNQLMPRMRAEFEAEPEILEHLKAKEIPQAFGIDLLVQMALHKRCDLQTLVGTLRHHCDKAQEVADLILKCVEADLCDYNDALRQFIVIFEIDAKTQEEIDRFQYPLPMVVEPRELKHNAQGAYLLNNCSVILRDNHHEDDVCLDHLNRMNQVKFKINFNTAHLIKNEWRNLDKPKEGEERGEFERRKRAFEKFDKTAHAVIDVLIREGNEFYFTHRPDKRGRTYCQGHHANYQGTPWNKAVIEFAAGEVTK
ncbi:hypothetical protein [Caballeronia sp. LZ034LL]|uniref:hypothetical protein n=1 Tax=Caballeronia sp. LZ034LL TaxID=3038567 RepID=UPI0028591410|nr:hypothetical protein [Caballeronia sp. LZ034LL]MDR5839350.1 hypothetical protein [Caballeronia sp. LZ034LL]